MMKENQPSWHSLLPNYFCFMNPKTRLWGEQKKYFPITSFLFLVFLTVIYMYIWVFVCVCVFLYLWAGIQVQGVSVSSQASWWSHWFQLQNEFRHRGQNSGSYVAESARQGNWPLSGVINVCMCGMYAILTHWNVVNYEMSYLIAVGNQSWIVKLAYCVFNHITGSPNWGRGGGGRIELALSQGGHNIHTYTCVITKMEEGLSRKGVAEEMIILWRDNVWLFRILGLYQLRAKNNL